MAAARFVLLLLLGISVVFTEVRCSAGVKTNGGRRSVSKPVSEVSPAKDQITLDVKPRGQVILGPQRRSVTLNCLLGPNQHQFGPSNFEWFHNDRPAPPCDPASRCILAHNGSLRIFYKKKSPKGREGNGTLSSKITGQKNEYRCVAHTSYGSLRSAPTHVIHAELDHAFSESPEDLTVREGEISRFSCQIESTSFTPNITWLHDGELVEDDRDDSKYVLISSGTLYIRATVLSDAGSYRCVATNELLNVTRMSKEAKLIVIAGHSAEESKRPATLFPQTSSSFSLRSGSNLRLACAASGYPSPTVIWSFYSKFADSGSAKHQTISNSSSGLKVLELKNIAAADAGIYACSMKNFRDDSTFLQNVTVEVLIPPSFIKKPTNQVCPNGRTARFECQAQGFPTPRIYWLKNAADVTINGRRTVYVKEFNKTELAISATVPADSGIYQCIAVNAVGEIWAAGRLQVNISRNSPAAPTSLKCEARSPVRIFISWEPPKLLPSSNITAYTVHYRPVEGGKEEVSPPEPGNTTSVEVTKLLEPYTNYTFYVRLWNSHGPSDQSETITCSTQASVPKTAPKISVNIISSTKLNITWKPLTKKEAQGIVTEYKLEWRLYQHPSVHVRTFSADFGQYVLTDLIPGEQYDLRVLARTELGWPNVSESQLGWITVLMPLSTDFIQSQIFVVNSSAIKIKWDFKSNSIIPYTSWKIHCKSADGVTSILEKLTRNTRDYLFTNLESNTSYAIDLCALNLGEIVHCVTKRADLKKITTSNAPTALEAIPLSPDSIILSWIAGNLDGHNIFEVCYDAVHLLNESLSCITVNTSTITINSLKPFTLYQFKVRTLNNDTKNPYSETIECFTKEDVPGKIKDIEWFLINSTKVKIAWKEPKNINGIIQRYFVAYSMEKSESKSAWTNITVFGNKTSANLPDLVLGKRYYVVVQAATKAGTSFPSEPIIILTGSNSSESPSSLDEQKPLPKTGEDRKLGVILGIAISVFCILVCLCSMYCRKKYESLRSLRESAQPLKNRVLRNGNGCCVDHSSTSISQPPVMSNEIELAVLCPPTPITNNPLVDSKGGHGHANGILENCAKEPLLAPWEINGTRNDLRITENPQYKQRDIENSDKLHLQQEESPDMNSTQLTTLNYDLEDSEESLNNNLGRCANDESETLSQKTAPTIVPVLEPNG